MKNPFEILEEKLEKIEEMLGRLDKKTIAQPEKNYTVKEVAEILKISEQTVRKKIFLRQIDADTNTKPFLIPHSSLYDENNQLRKFKYVRI